MDYYPTISRPFHLANPYQQPPPVDLGLAVYYNIHRRLLELEIERYPHLTMYHNLGSMDPYASDQAYEASHVAHQQYLDLCSMAYGHPSPSELTGYRIPHDGPGLYQRPMAGGGARRRHERKPAYQPGKAYPVKDFTDQIRDDHDASVLATMYNSDAKTAWTTANNLCSYHQAMEDEKVNDIVFFTDASARRITESKIDRDRGVNQWLMMRENPTAWRSGVAITWDISPASPLYNSSKQATPNTEATGTWHLETDKITPTQGEWRAPNEAAYQISGLQHFNQAELLGILFALERAVTIYRTYIYNKNNSTNKKLFNSITILTDSKPAMWDLTGQNWHTDRIRTDSEYWVLRQENTKTIVLQAKEYMKILRGLHVSVEIRWVPGHNGVPGNEWVDGLSRVARLLPSRFGNSKYDMKQQNGNENSAEKKCEKNSWEGMGLSGVEKETIVDTGLGLFYNAFEGNGLEGTEVQEHAATTDGARMDSGETMSNATSDDGAGSDSGSQETSSDIGDDGSYDMVTEVTVGEVSSDIGLRIVIPRLEEFELEDGIVEVGLDEVHE